MPFTTPFWGNSWTEATPRAVEQDKNPQEVAPIALSDGDSFFYESRRFVVRGFRAYLGLICAVEVGHETGVRYMFHPDDVAGAKIVRAPVPEQGIIYIAW